MSDSVLTLSNLTKVYKRSHLGRTTLSRGVEDISFDVRPGEVFGLLGLNGSGKTTTIKLVLGLLFPTHGSVQAFSKPVPHPAAQKRMGYLPEVPYSYRHLTPTEVLTFYGTLSGMARAPLRGRIVQVLEQVGLAQAARKPMKEFSKGMLQRVGVAQALLHDPDFLILDEPITGLDPLGIREMRHLIHDLNSQGKTIFFSSHSISELERLTHRVAILIEGKLIQIVASSEWKDRPGQLEDRFVHLLKTQGKGAVG